MFGEEFHEHYVRPQKVNNKCKKNAIHCYEWRVEGAVFRRGASL